MNKYHKALIAFLALLGVGLGGSLTVVIISIVICYLSDFFTELIRDFNSYLELREDKKDLEKLKKLQNVVDNFNEDTKDVSDKDTKDVIEGIKTIAKDDPEIYESFDEMMEKHEANKSKFEKFIHKHDILWKIRAFFYNILEHPEDLQQWIKHAYQRVTRGWSDRDVWSLDWHLAEILPPMLRRLKETKHGVPLSAFRTSDPTDENGCHTDEAMKLAEARFNKDLDSIIHTFEVAQLIQEDNWCYQNSSEYNVKLANRLRESNKNLQKKHPRLFDENHGYVMTKKECIAYEIGWKAFQSNFFGLWD